jgi:hypothetical protein
MPGVVTRPHGRGRVAYFAAGLDAGYYLYPYPYQRLALEQAIRWAADSPPPVEVTAPMCVHATVMRQQRDGERLVIHLFNDLNTTATHALPNEDVPLREETVPIHEIAVTLRSPERIARVHLEPEGVELPLKRTKNAAAVTVPRLDVHAMVVVELRTP